MSSRVLLRGSPCSKVVNKYHDDDDDDDDHDDDDDDDDDDEYGNICAR